MPSPFSSKGKGYSPFRDGPEAPEKHGHSPLGLVGNLVGDIKDTVVGLPMGLIETVRNPIKSAKAIGGATWQTWSPLFHGDFAKFGRQVYDHPLAPLLDVATVFSLGAAGAARGAGALEKAGVESSVVSKAAGLRRAKSVELLDPKGEKLPVQRHLSTRPGRRLLQEAGMLGPSWYTGPRNAMRFAHLDLVRDSGLVKATHEIHAAAIMQAGKVITDPETAPRALMEVAGGMYAGLLRHNAPVTLDEAHRLVKGGHYGYTLDVRQLDQQSSRLLRRARREEKTWQVKREKNAELAHALPKLEKELADANRELEQMYREGYRISQPASGAVPAGHVRLYRGEGPGREEGGIWYTTSREYAEAYAVGGELLHVDVPKDVAAKHLVARLKHFGKDDFDPDAKAEFNLPEDWTGRARPVSKGEPTATQRMEQEARPVLEVERRVKDLEKQLGKAHAAKAEHDKALSEIERLTDWRTSLEDRGYAEFFRRESTSLEDFAKFADNFGARVSTKVLAKAARPKVVKDGKWVDDDTRVYIHRRHDANMLGVEAKNSASFLGKAYRDTTGLWKKVQLGFTPRTITNNAVGNWLLAASRDNPVSTAVGLYDAIRITKGPEAALEAALGGTRHATPFKKNHWMYRYFGDELGNTFKQTLADETGKMPGRLGQGFYPLVHKLSDEPVRMAVISAFLRKSPEVKALKKSGLSTDKAIQRALRKHPHLRDQAANHARTTAGDYYTMRPVERALRDLVPFYLWDRHIVKTAGNMLADTPGRVALAQRVGSLGIERTEDILGELPEFLRGVIPLGKKGGRASVLVTSSLNPFATLGELAAAGEGLTTGGGLREGSSVLSQMNPLITGGIEAATGRSILTGAPKPGFGGLIPTLAVNTARGFPQVRLAEALLSPDATTTGAGNERLYATDDRSPLTSFLGIPLRNVSLEQAAAMAEREKPKKKKRKKSRFDKS